MSVGIVRVTIVVKGLDQVRVLPIGLRLELDTPSGIVGGRTWREVLGRDLAHIDVVTPPAPPVVDPDPATEE